MSSALPVVTNIPLIWRLRLALHGVAVSRFAHDDLTRARGARHVAWRVTMIGEDLSGAEAAPLQTRVNLRAASFVLRRFGLQRAQIRADARGALLAVSPLGAGKDRAPRARARTAHANPFAELRNYR